MSIYYVTIKYRTIYIYKHICVCIICMYEILHHKKSNINVIKTIYVYIYISYIHIHMYTLYCGEHNFYTFITNMCCLRDCVSRHNGGTSGAPLIIWIKLSTLRGLRGAPEVPPLCRETQSLGQQMLNAPFGINGLK